MDECNLIEQARASGDAAEQVNESSKYSALNANQFGERVIV